MNDPRVDSLRYYLKTAETVKFDDPPPLEKETDTLWLRLENAVVTVWPKYDYASEQEARECAEPYLRSWEAYEAIRRAGRYDVGFEFASSEIIDRDPPPPGATQVIRPRSMKIEIKGGSPTLVSWDKHYPEPPENFVTSATVEFMLRRYQEYLQGREPLLSMAYACLCRLQFDCLGLTGKGSLRQKTAREYGIDDQVLGKLGHLTAVLGDETGARKVTAHSENRAPMQAERRWIEQCVMALVRRAGEYASAPQKPLPQLTMSDLPRL